MDLLSSDSLAAFGLLVVEAAQNLVDVHDESLDKRAALLKVEQPTLHQNDGDIRFDFRVAGNRQKTETVQIHIIPDDDIDLDEVEAFQVSLRADAVCECVSFQRDGSCPHTLASAWWLQEQLGRRNIQQVLEFFGTLERDSVSDGRELVKELLTLADNLQQSEEVPTTRLQWRIGITDARYYCPVSVRAYEQRPRKSGRGWTKGRELRAYDLLQRDFSHQPIDGQIAALVADPSYSFNEDHFSEFQAIRLLIGHPNVVWDDQDARGVSVQSGQLSLAIEVIEIDESEAGDQDGPDQESSPDDEAIRTKFRPKLHLGGQPLNPEACDIIKGYASPSEPVLLIVDQDQDRIVYCPLPSQRAIRMFEFLLRSDWEDALLDFETANLLAVQASKIHSLINVDLPLQLAGPLEPVEPELVIELRPRVGAGTKVALGMHDPRFEHLMTPGSPPQTVTCLTPEGPIRLGRDLAVERNAADQVTERFALHQFSSDGSYRWVAETDEDSLDLLGRLHAAGEEAPRIIWPEGESIRVRGEITPSSLRVQIDDRRDWFGMSGVIDLQGHQVALSDVLSAVQDNRSLVRVGDREFAKISDEFRQRLRQLSDSVVSERGGLKIADAAVPSVQDLIGEDVILEAADRWHQSIENLQSLHDWTPEKPSELDVEFRHYQLEGYQWLARLSRWGVGGVLADDMGLGKTVQALGVLCDRGDGGPALVIAPTSVGDNWVREANRFAPTLNPILYRDSNRDELIKTAKANDLVIVSYQLLQRDAKRFASRIWNTLVLDEAQFIKNAQTKTAQSIRRIDANWRIGLSGTPLENHLGELWSLFRTLSPGLLGSWDRFRNRFAEPIERHRDDERRTSLARLVRPFILRRTKEKVLTELPPRTEITVQAVLSKEERRLYEEARMAAVAELSGAAIAEKGEGDRRIRTLAWLTKLRQLSCHPQLVDRSWKKGSAKLSLMMELINELRDEDHRALVFSQFVKHLDVVRKQLDQQGIAYQYLDGSTPAKERQRRVDAFQNGEGDLFLISLKAGGTGLNLTAADYVFHLDPWWNPAVEDQATDRAHRIGQERPVTVYRLVAQGTIEEQILQMHADKRELVAGVLDGTDGAAKLNTQDLINLIKEGVAQS
ncbi:DEAD/DEAH box helicase [Crateriforma conspicua]|uniref:ATP-dependent helicase HepA n=1 Tax=Crateriforma conspicua TaxID=2527996 RepID=A0A5C5Y3B2_9PLAN|nr:DEAD/DEAH box helicase [Crateriforma conspicua]TWT70256.1 ATP-dependent helicase HepA [Crateriforma conspicua]